MQSGKKKTEKVELITVRMKSLERALNLIEVQESVEGAIFKEAKLGCLLWEYHRVISKLQGSKNTN